MLVQIKDKRDQVKLCAECGAQWTKRRRVAGLDLTCGQKVWCCGTECGIGRARGGAGLRSVEGFIGGVAEKIADQTNTHSGCQGGKERAMTLYAWRLKGPVRVSFPRSSAEALSLETSRRVVAVVGSKDGGNA